MASKFSAEAQASIEVLRALLNIQKRPITLSILLKEYRDMEGGSLPFRNFGFKTAEEFLKTSGEFLVMIDRGEVLVGARPNKDSAHIVNMIARQKPSKKRSKRSSYGYRNRMPAKSGQSWDKTSYLSNVYRNLPSSRTGTDIKNRLQSLPSSRIGTDKLQKQDDKSRILLSQSQKMKSAQTNAFSNINTKLNVNETKSDPQKLMQKNPNSTVKLSDISSLKTKSETNKDILKSDNKGDENVNNLQQSKYKFNDKCDLEPCKSLAMKSYSEKMDHNGNILTLSNRLVSIYDKDDLLITFKNKEESNRMITIYNKSDLKISFENTEIKTVSSSLAEKPTKDSINSTNIEDSSKGNLKKSLENNSQSSELMAKNEKADLQNIKLLKPTECYKFDFRLSAVRSLEEYCMARGYPKPQYESKYYNGLLYSVLINGKKYTTYPKYFNDPEIAKNACSAIAVEEIKLEESKIYNYPICTDLEENFLLKIYEELKSKHTSGIFIKMFPKFFESKFQQSLPENWFSLIENSKYFILESTVDTENSILVANLYLDEIDTFSKSDQFAVDEIALPWQSRYWNLYITHCSSSIEIWARIVDKEYSQQLDSLLNYIESTMSVEKILPDTLTTGHIYLVYISDCWHRVRLITVNIETNQCLCFFIDFGDDDWLSIDQLYVCDRKFLKLSAQAVPFSLFGLEDFAENPVANKYISEMIMGTTLIAKVCTEKEIYESQTNEASKIEVVLYDTSSIVDIVINEVLIEKICNGIPTPEIKQHSPTNVNVTYITENGEIYLQILDFGLRYVQKLIAQLIESKFQEDHYKINSEDLNLSTLYLILDKDDKKWYRGCLVDIDIKNRNAKEFKMFYVDYGFIKQIHISNIFCLESLSTALSRYPRQAIKAKMYNLPPINNFVLNKLKILLPNNSLAIARLALNELTMDHNVIPQVIIFIRIEGNQSLCNVNDAIRMEYELISDECSIEMYNSPTKNDYNSDSSNSFITTPSKSVTQPLKISPLIIPPTLLHGSLPIELNSIISLPEKGEIFNVFVTVVLSPFDFYVRSCNDIGKIEDMMTELQNYCRNNKEIISEDMIEPGEAYAACLEDGLYYRCIIEKTLPNQKCCVYFCDSGKRNIIGVEILRTLPSKCRELPTQAIKAKLHGILPIKGKWSFDDNKRFKELTMEKKFMAIVKNISYDTFDSYKNSKILELKLMDQPKGIVIHEMLLEENRAILS